MLILQRREGQSLVIDGKTVVTVQEIGQGRVKIAVDAPREVSIFRSELIEAKKENRYAAEGKDSPIELLEILRTQQKSAQETE